MSGTASSPCPACGAAATGNFCSACGAAIGARACPQCHTSLSPGAKFCHGCGAAVNAGVAAAAGATPVAVTRPVAHHSLVPAPASAASQPLWLLVTVLGAITIAAVVYAARGRTPAAPPTAAAAAAAPTGNAPDISNMTPREQFTRLSDRVSTAAAQGDTASVAMFWPMLLGAYQNLSAADRDVDARFHMGWLYREEGQYAQASAFSDSILTMAPNNLLGLLLRYRIAEAKGDSAGATRARAAYLAHYATEIKRADQPEYTEHRTLLDDFRKNAALP